MSSRPLVSVITPSLNQAEFLPDCLASVEGQTYPSIERVVVDGASDDGSVEVLRRHRREGLRWISEADRGQAHAINKGLDLAAGEIVCWLNSDDLYFDETAIEAVVAAFESRSRVDLVVGDGYRCDRQGRLLNPIILDGNALGLAKMRREDLVLQPSAFWRRSASRLDESFCYAFDWLFFLAMFEQSMNVLYLRRYLSRYRWYGTNKTAQDTSARRREIVRVLRRSLGPTDPSTLWCAAVFAFYRLSELTGMAWLKQLARRSNSTLKALTRYRIGAG